MNITINNLTVVVHHSDMIDLLNGSIDFDQFKVKLLEKIDNTNGEIKPVVTSSKKTEKSIGQKMVLAQRKVCATCGQEFKPSGNRQKYCRPECGMNPVSRKKQPVEPIEKTIEEIERAQSAREKEPYVF